MRPKHLVQSRNYIIPNTSAVIRPSLFTRYSIHYLNKFDLVFSFTAYSGNLVDTLMKDSFLSICGKKIIHMFRYDDETDHKLSQFTPSPLEVSPINDTFSFRSSLFSQISVFSFLYSYGLFQIEQEGLNQRKPFLAHNSSVVLWLS